MATYNYKPGLGNAASYQVSGIPYVTGGVNALAPTVALAVCEFPLVTRWIIVHNNGATEARIGFSENGVEGTNYFTIDAGETSPRLEVKVTEVWLSGSNNMAVVAGLTGIENIAIDNSSVSPLGTNWSGSTNATVG